VTDIYYPEFQRDLTKNEAGIRPELDMDSTVKFSKPKKVETVAKSAFETQIN